MNRYTSILMLLVATCLPIRGATWETQMDVGPLFNFARYELGALPNIQGYLAGVYTDCEIRRCNGFYADLRFFGRWNAGFVCGELDLKSNIKDYRPELLLGWSWYGQCNTLEVTPYTGFGFYYLANQIQPDIITLRYTSLFIPVGFSIRKSICSNAFEWGFSALYRPYVWTKAKAITPAITPCDNSRIELKRSHGAHINMPFTWIYPLTCYEADFQFKIVPFFDWNRFGASDETNCTGIPLGLPKLDRWYLGLHFDFGLRF